MLKSLHAAAVYQKHLGSKCALYDLARVESCQILTEAK